MAKSDRSSRCCPNGLSLRCSLSALNWSICALPSRARCQYMRPEARASSSLVTASIASAKKRNPEFSMILLTYDTLLPCLSDSTPWALRHGICQWRKSGIEESSCQAINTPQSVTRLTAPTQGHRRDHPSNQSTESNPTPADPKCF